MQRYDDLGTINSVKILSTLNNYNGYIQLYTELDSHIEEGDVVFLTYSRSLNKPIESDIVLDNFLYTIDNGLYSEFSDGYLVIYVNKNNNTFVINRKIETVKLNKSILHHYVSKITINDANITNGSIDSSFFRYLELSGATTKWIQGVIYSGETNDLMINKKYDDNYLSLKQKIINNNYSKYFTINNDGYGYSEFLNISPLKNSIINSGIYNKCNIISTNYKDINNGYFIDSIITKYNINYGNYINTELYNCIWNDGKWYSNNEFLLDTWNDGVFYGKSMSSATTWKNGVFLSGTFNGKSIEGGKIKSGNIIGDFTNNYMTIKNTIINGGFIYNNNNKITILDSIVSGGLIQNSIIQNSTLNNGNIKNSTISSSIIDGISISTSYVFDNEYDSGIISTSKIFDSIFHTKEINISNNEMSYNNILYNGTFSNNIFKKSITIGSGYFNDNIFNITNGTIQKCKITSTYLKDSNGNKKVFTLILENGHNIRNSSLSIILGGFSNNLLNGTHIIDTTTYTDPTDYNGSSFNSVEYSGNTYVLLSGITWDDDYDGNIGYIQYNNTTINEQIVINNGYFKLDDMSNVTINNGYFNGTYIHSGSTFNNGNFDGGLFLSTIAENIDNNWYGGTFYNGDFGNVNNNNDISYITISSGGTNITSKTSIINNTIIKIVSIYPRLYDTYYNKPKDITLSSSTYNQFNPWVDVSTETVLPYQMIVKIDCGSEKIRFGAWIDNIQDSLTISLVDMAFEKNIDEWATSNKIKEAFNDLYDDGYILKPFIDNENKETYYYDEELTDFVYLKFESEKIKKLYDIGGEKNSFKYNFKNNWSIANTGYYTHPLPILSGSNTDFTTTYQFDNHDSEWIYGTGVPPWWLDEYEINNQDYKNMYNYVNWCKVSGLTSNTCTEHNTAITFTTPTHFNNKPVNSYTIDVNSTPYILPYTIKTIQDKYTELKSSTHYYPFDSEFITWMSFHTKHRNNSGDTTFGFDGSIYNDNLLESLSASTGNTNSSGWVFVSPTIIDPEPPYFNDSVDMTFDVDLNNNDDDIGNWDGITRPQ